MTTKKSEAPIDWCETALWAVLDLLLHEKEGEVHVKTKSGRECKIAVRFENEVGFLTKGGAG